MRIMNLHQHSLGKDTEGKVAVWDNLRSSRLIGSKEKFKTRGQDKGHAAELKAFVDAIHNGSAAPIPVSGLIGVTRSSLDAAAAVHRGILQRSLVQLQIETFCCLPLRPRFILRQRLCVEY